MSVVFVPGLQQSRDVAQPRALAVKDKRLLPAGQAHGCRPGRAMQLRVLRGRAWVTLGAGPGGWGESSGDVMLYPGQTLHVAAGQSMVIEPLGAEGLDYQWCAG
ncbi:hypothetical protein MASR1M59_12550 [Melaminivora sp.]